MNHRASFPVKLSVSIVLHRSSLDLLARTLCSLREAASAAREAGVVSLVAVTLVDNASGTQYQAALARLLHDAPADDVLQLAYAPQRDNLGFGHGHNIAIGASTGDCHLVLNPDVELRADTLRAGVAALMGDAAIVLVSPRAVGGNGEPEFLCKRYPSVLVLLLRGFGPAVLRRWFQPRLAKYEMRDACAGSEPVDVTIASGCFMLMRTDALRAVRGFDEAFFLYFEDFDLSLRLAERGRLLFHPGVQILHHGGYAASKGRRHWQYFIASGVRFFNRHGWRWV